MQSVLAFCVSPQVFKDVTRLLKAERDYSDLEFVSVGGCGTVIKVHTCSHCRQHTCARLFVECVRGFVSKLCVPLQAKDKTRTTVAIKTDTDAAYLTIAYVRSRRTLWVGFGLSHFVRH